MRKISLTLIAIFIIVSCYAQAYIDERNIPKSVLETTKFASNFDLQQLLDSIKDNEIVYVDMDKFESNVSYKLKNKKNISIIFNKNASIFCYSTHEDVFKIDSCCDIEILNGTFKHIIEENETCKGSVFKIYNSENIKLSNCDINGSGAIGIDCYNIKNINVTSCCIHDNSLCAYEFWNNCKNIFLFNNKVEKNGDSGIKKFYTKLYDSDDILPESSIHERDLTTNEILYLDSIYSIHNNVLATRIPM